MINFVPLQDGIFYEILRQTEPTMLGVKGGFNKRNIVLYACSKTFKKITTTTTAWHKL